MISNGLNDIMNPVGHMDSILWNHLYVVIYNSATPLPVQ
ncbi:hypothetical protein A3Q56_05756 [Intoshia linei]|uniref:Uncharacterized protein n=1 Tax=Intoshia linei TaxID=1819745 RepID=A0A177AYD4_9BILA|nr:hypothetical protein A3Q56_05756 [Intoshia linei]